MTSRSLNLCHVPRRFTPKSWGGTETVIAETSAWLQRRGHQVQILTTSALAEPGPARVRGLSVHRVPYFYPYLGLGPEAKGQLDRCGGNLFAPRLLSTLLRQPRLDLIHLHTGKRLGGLARVAAQLRGIPYIISLHGGQADTPSQEARRYTAPTQGALEWGKALGLMVGSRRVLQDAAAVLTVSEAEAKALGQQLPGRPIYHVPNGVDAHRFAVGDGAAFRERFAIPQDAKLLLNVGRLDPQKNQAFLLEVLAAMLPSMPEAHLLLLGPITDEAYHRGLQAKVKAAGLEGQVTIIPGLTPDDPGLVNAYHAADALLFPSRHEPFGIVVLEAWAAGLPVVVNPIGGLNELVREQANGFKRSVSDVAGWADAAEALLTQATLRRQLIAAGRQEVEQRYSWDRVGARLETIYQEVLA